MRGDRVLACRGLSGQAPAFCTRAGFLHTRTTSEGGDGVESAQDQRPVYQNGKWEADLALRELRVSGRFVPISGRAFEIIEVLVRSAGELVTKDDLMRRVWPGAIVEDNTLQVHISAVRKAFGADRG